MKNKILLIISIIFVATGSYGLYWVKKSSQQQLPEKVLQSFDPLLLSESEIFRDVDSSNTERVSSLLRESKKRKPTIKDWIINNFDNEKLVVQQAMLISLGNYKEKEAVSFLIEKVNQKENEIFSLYALKGLSSHEDLIRVLSLQEVDLNNRSDKFLIHYHFSLFKTKSYFTDKKKDLYWLVEKARSLKDSEELKIIIMGLSEFVPNFEKFHDLLQEIVFISTDEVILNRAIIHLSVYNSGWLKVQTNKIMATQNETLIKEFLARSGAFCPIDIWDALTVYAKEYDPLEAIKMAARVNMKKAEEIGNEIGYNPIKLAEVLKIKNSTLCY